MKAVLSLSGVYSDENWDFSKQSPEAMLYADLSSQEGACCYCDSDAAEAIRKAVSRLTACPIHWIDTGDYHYISLLWMETVKEAFALALYDNHPDDQPSAFENDDPSILSCGSWVRSARKALPLLKTDVWNGSTKPSMMAESIPSDFPVWLSIDLDVLSTDYARTDWDQGNMSLDELLQSISSIFAGHRVIAADICGGITISKGGNPEDLAVNRRTRSIIQDFLEKKMKQF